MAKRWKKSQSDVTKWMEEQYRKSPGLRQEVETEVEEMELAMGLVKLREDRGVSQAQLAKLIGVTQPAVAKIESGKAKVKVHTLKLYARALGGDVKVQIVRGKGWENVVPMRRGARKAG